MSVVSQDGDDAQTIQEMKAMMKAQMEEIESVRAQIAKIESKVRKQKRNSNDVESGDKITEELSDDDVKQLLFEGSTHQFLFLDRIQNPDDGTDYTVGRWNKFIGLVVIILQLYSYVQVLVLISDYVECNPGKDLDSDLSDMVMDPVSAPVAGPGSNAKNPTNLPTMAPTMLPTRSSTFQQLGSMVCEVQDPLAFAKKSYYIPAFLLLLCFLSQDLFGAVVLFRCRGCMAKVTSILIFLEAAFAIIVAFVGTVLGFPNERLGVLDTFLLIVGVIFVHEVDEQIGYWKVIQRKLGGKFPYSETIVWTVFLVLGGFIIAGLLLAMSDVDGNEI